MAEIVLFANLAGLALLVCKILGDQIHSMQAPGHGPQLCREKSDVVPACPPLVARNQSVRLFGQRLCPPNPVHKRVRHRTKTIASSRPTQSPARPQGVSLPCECVANRQRYPEMTKLPGKHVTLMSSLIPTCEVKVSQAICRLPMMAM